MDLFEIYKTFDSEPDCQRYLASIRWPEKVECVYCRSKKVYCRSRCNGYKCPGCNKSFTVTTGTLFHSTKLPLLKWFLAIAQILAAKKGISSLQLSRTIAVNKNTAWFMQHRIRRAMKTDVLLRGLVEVDETYIGGALVNMHKNQKQKRNPYRSGMVHKIPVLGMIERATGKAVLHVIAHADGVHIKPILKRQVSQESELITDGFGGYAGLHKHFNKHVKMNHEKRQRSKGKYNLSRIEGFFTLIKRALIGQYHRLDRIHLQSYMDEITFKKNIAPAEAFNVLLNRMCAVF
jgi:transposase-like protein